MPAQDQVVGHIRRLGKASPDKVPGLWVRADDGTARLMQARKG